VGYVEGFLVIAVAKDLPPEAYKYGAIGRHRRLTEFLDALECYQCGEQFDSMEQIAVHCFYHPGHRLPQGLEEYLPDRIVRGI